MSTHSQDGTRHQFMAPGWYPDPARPTDLRRWDGYAWTDESRPAPAQPAPSRHRAAEPSGQFWDRSRLSIVAVVVSLVYLVVDNYTHFVIFGLIPISLSIQAVKRREPLCAAAIVGTIAAVAAPFLLFPH
ncbi:DUF2510 domain-containing protein [Nocardia stercoris]|uniref:DUF2510 domain-containing protein n=1 Tax=Nocardia stercoris TaxID=2483361 RepID=A0A3M2L1Y7_9NOCA|nr:DUF2510 domain-containing protein [Nocardia stercoris]RMI30956.1 DUF2510 domain-containing protein [Nocardia stercoris]